MYYLRINYKKKSRVYDVYYTKLFVNDHIHTDNSFMHIFCDVTMRRFVYRNEHIK